MYFDYTLSYFDYTLFYFGYTLSYFEMVTTFCSVSSPLLVKCHLHKIFAIEVYFYPNEEYFSAYVNMCSQISRQYLKKRFKMLGLISTNINQDSIL